MLLPAPPQVYIKTWGMDTNKLACVHTLIVFQCKIKIYIKKKTPCSPLTYIPSQRLPTEIHTQPNRDDWALFLWLKEHLFSFLLSQYPETIRETRGLFFFFLWLISKVKEILQKAQAERLHRGENLCVFHSPVLEFNLEVIAHSVQFVQNNLSSFRLKYPVWVFARESTRDFLRDLQGE